jgi:membrane-bound metal-dependent hydrolase YbcI (DUF457 family)
LIARIGTFFLLIGTGLVLLFFFSDVARSANLSLLFYGVLLFVLGVLFRIRGYQKPEPNESRFRVLRRKKTSSNPEEKNNKSSSSSFR